MDTYTYTYIYTYARINIAHVLVKWYGGYICRRPLSLAFARLVLFFLPCEETGKIDLASAVVRSRAAGTCTCTYIT